MAENKTMNMTDRWIKFSNILMDMRHDPDVSEETKQALTQVAIFIQANEAANLLERIRFAEIVD